MNIKEGGMNFKMVDDVSETVLTLLDSGRISWPRSVSDRNKFITENFGKVWDALLDINIHSNLAVFSNIENDETDYVSYDEHNSSIAWDALGEVLMLILILEDALGTDITFSSKYGEPNEFSTYKAKIRSRVGS